MVEYSTCFLGKHMVSNSVALISSPVGLGMPSPIGLIRGEKRLEEEIGIPRAHSLQSVEISTTREANPERKQEGEESFTVYSMESQPLLWKVTVCMWGFRRDS